MSTSDFRESNMRVLREKFPHLLTILQAAGAGGVETRDTAEGPVLFSEGQCLDHAQKPRLAGEKWAAQLQNEDKLRDITQVVVYGMGAAYHLEALQQTCPLALSVIEPDAAVFAAAIRARDLSSCLAKLKHLVVGQTEVPKIFDEASELIVRPQSAVVSAEFCQKVRAAFYGQRGLTSLHPRIGIVGPMQGGTLPIAAYCQRAFSILRQRNRFYDLSGFAPGFHIYDQYIFDKMRKSSAQGHYLQMLSQMLLDSIDEKPVDILFCLAQAPLTVQALEILRAKGVITVLWFMEDYLRFTYWKQMAPYYDFVFTFQRGECLQAIKAAGAGEVHYVPVGCDPDVHRSAILTDEEKARWGSPLSFVGAGYHNRQQMFASLAGLPFKIWGTEWPECRPFDRLVQERGRRLTPEEYVKIFNATDININLHSSTEKDGVDPNGDFVNPRTFELASAGAFQLVDERLLLPEAFEAGKELVTFRNTADLKDKIAYYMQRPEERRQIALAGQKRAINEHTYVHRLRDILSSIYSSRYEQLRRRDDGGGWNRLLKRAKPHEELSKRCNDSFVRGEEATLDGLVADIVTGEGKLTETEMKLLFLHHVRSQIIRMTIEEAGATR